MIDLGQLDYFVLSLKRSLKRTFLVRREWRTVAEKAPVKNFILGIFKVYLNYELHYLGKKQ